MASAEVLARRQVGWGRVVSRGAQRGALGNLVQSPCNLSPPRPLCLHHGLLFCSNYVQAAPPKLSTPSVLSQSLPERARYVCPPRLQAIHTTARSNFFKLPLQSPVEVASASCFIHEVQRPWFGLESLLSNYLHL